MHKSYIILTDSLGVQEEASSLGKPVLVMRDVTERTEGIDADTAKIVGTDKDEIVRGAQKLINEKVNTTEWQMLLTHMEMELQA
jgi:UDP-N-acetylglucosamine 2-epimerase (non-hydrolysing)